MNLLMSILKKKVVLKRSISISVKCVVFKLKQIEDM